MQRYTPISENVQCRRSALLCRPRKGAEARKRLGTREIPGWCEHRSVPPTPCLFLRKEQSPTPSFSVSHHGADRRVGQVELARDVCRWVLLQRERENEKQEKKQQHKQNTLARMQPFFFSVFSADKACLKGYLLRQFRIGFIQSTIRSDVSFHMFIFFYKSSRIYT